MRRYLAGRRHIRPVGLEAPSGPSTDDLTTWSNTASLSTMVLPGSANDSYKTIVDVTKYIDSNARADVGGLRFRRSDGLRLGHYRTSSNRILVSCDFHGGKNTIDYFWGKSGATQPGDGFPSSSDVMEPYRLALIFDGGVAVDLSSDPASFSVVGTPTITTGLHGQAMQFGDGSYIQTNADKLRVNARSTRAAFALTRNNPETELNSRVICFANWLTNQRAFQLWLRSDAVELYIADEAGGGIGWNKWSKLGLPKVGYNTIACSWQANVREALVMMNHSAEKLNPDFAGTPGPIFNANTPYIFGGTPVSGFYNSGVGECLFELKGLFSSENHMNVWSYAWGESDTFWGVADRTPDNFDVPDLTNQPINSVVSFAPKQITGISSGTRIAIDGSGSPTYSIGSASTTPGNIKAEGNTDGTINSGNWLFTKHTTPATYSTITESTVTIGTGESKRRSTTIQEPVTPPTQDRTPDSFSIAEQTDVALNSEVSFPIVQISGMDAGTAISISGAGSPTFSISSSSSGTGDIRAKSNSSTTINPGQWVKVFHTSSGLNFGTTQSTLTVGTVSVNVVSRTIAAPGQPGGGGNTGIPPGAATKFVNNLSELKSAINSAKGGDVIEIPYGYYRDQGSWEFSNKDFRGGPPLTIRASVRGYRGYMPTQGGLWVSGEDRFTNGSRGAEFGYARFRNIHNIVFDGIRVYRGKAEHNVPTYSIELGGCSYITFQYCKFCGYKPATDESTWVPYHGSAVPYPNEWSLVGRAVNLGRSLSLCSFITFKHCLFHYSGLGIDFAGTADSVAEDCVFTDHRSDHVRNDGAQHRMRLSRNIFYRTFPQRGTNIDIDHPDAVQSTTKTQPGPVNHYYDDNIVSIGDGGHGKQQGFFLECDNFPQYPQGYGNTIRNNLMHSPTVNTIYIRPADRNTVEYCTVIADMGAAQAPDGSQQINFTATTGNGKSFGNNTVRRCVYDSISYATGDQLIENHYLARSQYETAMVHYPSSWKKSGFTPVRVLNPYTGVINLTHVGYMAPRANSPIHPNQKGYHIGASSLFQRLGVLP